MALKYPGKAVTQPRAYSGKYLVSMRFQRFKSGLPETYSANHRLHNECTDCLGPESLKLIFQLLDEPIHILFGALAFSKFSIRVAWRYMRNIIIQHRSKHLLPGLEIAQR
jgi:hypothetical protein